MLKQWQLDPCRFSLPQNGQWHFVLRGDLLDLVLKLDAQTIVHFDHSLIVHRRVADFRDHIPLLERVGRLRGHRTMHNHPLHRRIEMKKLSQRRILQCLEIVIHRQLAAVLPLVVDAFKKQLYFLAWNDVANVLRRPAESAESETNHLVAYDGWAAAVAGVDGGIDLDAQPVHGSAVTREFDPGYDSFGNRETGSACR